MCSGFLKLLLIMFVATPLCAQKAITFCADPQNPPFSTRQGRGFENKIAEMIGAELHQPVRFKWQRMGRGFLREIVNKGECDAVTAVPVGMRGLRVSKPYFRSTYVFVTRRSTHPIESLDDARLANMKIGVQVLEDDYAPPARALARRRLTKNVVGFEMDENAGDIIAAVAHRKVDTAIVWGPLAGYYAKQYGSALRLTAVKPEVDPPMLPFTYQLGVGVRKSDTELLNRIESALQIARPKIQRILKAYNVPTLPMGDTPQERAGQ